jgi:hypothetical protein
MVIRSEADNRFLLKYLIIGLIGIAFGFWAIYDRYVKYPAMLPRAEAWEAILADDSLTDDQRSKAYKELAEAKGWPQKRPTADESVKKIKDLFTWQYIFMALGFGAGVPLVAWYLKNKGSWIELRDDNTIVSSWGQQVSFDQIERFDKKKWEKKGIGVVHYNDGGAKKFILDDLKFARKSTDQIVRIMEEKIGKAKIVNGLPEENQVSGTKDADDSATGLTG